jgi:hypothetical protein
MTTDIQITVEQGITRVVYRGQMQFDVTTEMLRKVGRIAAENLSVMLLIDVREAGEGQYHVNAIRHAEQAHDLGIDRGIRIALLVRQGDPRFPYVEDVMVNRGFQAKAFTDEAEAVAWLRASRAETRRSPS